MTHEELAEASGVRPRTISDLERGVALTPRKETVRLLADALGLAGEDRAGFDAASREHALASRGAASPRDDPAAGPEPAEHVPPSAPASAREAATRALPRDIGSFTGREAELARIVRAAEGAGASPGTDASPGTGGLVSIYAIEGMAGIGKTALALRAAHQIAGQYPDGQLFLDLRGFTDGLEPLTAGEALGSLLRALGTPAQLIPERQDERAALYRSRLAGTKTLIVLDNASSTAQVTPLLPGTAGCLVLVTSRRSLRGLDDALAVPLDVLAEPEAIVLLRMVAGRDRVPASDPALAEIAALCGCLPLAVRLVAARISRRPAMSAGDALGQLRREHGRLAHLRDEDRSLAAAFESSFRHLPSAEQAMFRHLGLVPGPDFDAWAAANLAGVDPDVAERLLDSLLDHNLLLQHTPGRYRLHDLVRVYARALGSSPRPGDEPEHATAATDRLLDYYLAAAAAADRQFERRVPGVAGHGSPTAPSGIPSLGSAERAKDWFAAEFANLDAAARHAAGHGRPGHAVALSAALAQYLRAHGPWAQALTLHRAAADAARDAGDVPGEAGALSDLGVIQRQAGALDLAADTFEQSLARYRKVGDQYGEASALVDLGTVQRLASALTEAQENLALALRLYRDLGDRHGQAGALAELAVVQRQAGGFAPAVASLTSALAYYRELGNRLGEAATLTYLGSVHLSAGNLAPAEESLSGALRLFAEMGEPIGQANNLLYLGAVHRQAQAYPKAVAALTRALELYGEFGDRRGMAGALAYLGAAQTLTGDHAGADESLTEALRLFRELGDPGGEAEALGYHAALAAATGSPLTARDRYRRALRLAREISSAKDEADALDGIGATYRAQGHRDRALSHYLQALARYESLGCTADAARARAAIRDLAGE